MNQTLGAFPNALAGPEGDDAQSFYTNTGRSNFHTSVGMTGAPLANKKIGGMARRHCAQQSCRHMMDLNRTMSHFHENVDEIDLNK